MPARYWKKTSVPDLNPGELSPGAMMEIIVNGFIVHDNSDPFDITVDLDGSASGLINVLSTAIDFSSYTAPADGTRFNISIQVSALNNTSVMVAGLFTYYDAGTKNQAIIIPLTASGGLEAIISGFNLSAERIVPAVSIEYTSSSGSSSIILLNTYIKLNNL